MSMHSQGQLVTTPSTSRSSMRLRSLLKISPAIILSLGFLIVVVVFAIFGPVIVPHGPNQQDLLNRLKPPAWTAAGEWQFPLGTDHLGRDILSRLIIGARISILVATIGVALAGTIGILVGLLAGYFGGRLDDILMRLADMQLALPFILLAIIIIGIFGPTFTNIIAILVVTSWVTYARVIRSEVMSLKQRQFVEAAKALGQKESIIILRHVFPNAINAILVVATLDIGRMIFLESALSFLGLGLPPPAISWGSMLADGKLYLATAWWLATLPGLIITGSILAINFVGDWLRDRLDPRLGRR